MDNIKKYLTDEKVDDFLINKLKFPNWKSILQRDKLGFLTQLLQKHTTHVYFQNIKMTATHPDYRGVPTLEQLINSGLNGTGGVCLQLNYFINLLLTSLGLDSFAIAGTVQPGMNDNHCMTVVRLGHDELYLLDAASANPLDEPVPLHNLPHKRQVAGFFYEFRLCSAEDPSVFGRYQLGGSFFHGQFVEDPLKEVLRFDFTLTPRGYDFFEHPLNALFTDPTCSPFLVVPFIFRYTKNEFTDPDGKEWLLVYGLNVVVADKNSRKVIKCLHYEELEVLIRQYFPGLDGKELETAFEYFKSANVADSIRQPS